MSEEADKSWPGVVFRGESLRDVGLDEASVAEHFRCLAEDLFGEPLRVVRRVIVADSDLYSDAIRDELGALHNEGDATHTDRPQYTGIARTLPVYHNNGTVENTIVLQAGVVAASLNKNGVEPTIEEYLGRYIIQHELAHCWDHAARKQPAPVGLSDGEFSVTRIGIYYKHILMAEFIACALPGARLQDHVFAELCRIDADPLEEEISTILNMRTSYVLGISRDLREVAFASSQCAWLVLVQYAKVFGHMHGGGRASAEISVPQVIKERPDALAVIHDLAQFLGTKLDEYPQWPDDGWSELDAFWDRLALSLGFRFITTADGSELWFD
jgi:hypothetical protein